jgi:hypothetical protein
MSTFRPPSIPPEFFIPSWKPSNKLVPKTADGPEKFEMNERKNAEQIPSNQRQCRAVIGVRGRELQDVGKYAMKLRCVDAAPWMPPTKLQPNLVRQPLTLAASASGGEFFCPHTRLFRRLLAISIIKPLSRRRSWTGKATY